METAEGGGYKARVTQVEKNDQEVRLRICYYAHFLFWPEGTEFETSVKSSSSLYQEAMKLKKGDVVWAIPDDEHEIYSCYPYGFFKKWKNRLFH